jgi:hypothetical protein
MGEKGGYAITLLDSSRAAGAETIASSYASRQPAFTAADAIAEPEEPGHPAFRARVSSPFQMFSLE